MEILFKLSNTGGNAPKVGDSNFHEHYSAVNADLPWATLKPSILRATKEHLIPHISKELYDALADAYHNTPDDLTDSQLEFLQQCQDTVAYYAILMVSPELNVSASPMGMVEKGSASTPVNPVTQWRYKDFRYDIAKKADRCLDGVIRLLEMYVNVLDIAFFHLWKDSTAYNDTRTVFFHSAAQFDKYVKISGSRRLFTQIMSDITIVEEEIDRIICIDQFNALNEAIQEDDLDADQAALVEYIRRYVASKAMSSAAAGMFLTLDTHGLSLSSYTDGMEGHHHASTVAQGFQAVSAYVQKLRNDADLHYKVMMNFIHSNIDTYPLIKDSDCYQRFNASRNSSIISTGKGAIFMC